MKEHAIIEKTAKFISAQGAQMEILIKTKQSRNSQFDFLMQNNRLYPYYKHVHNSIKNGIYPKDEQTQEFDDNKTEQTEQLQLSDQQSTNTITDGGNSYFSVFSSSLRSASTITPQIAYKPSADCSYTQLISKIKGVPLPDIDGLTTTTVSQTSTPPPVEIPTVFYSKVPPPPPTTNSVTKTPVSVEPVRKSPEKFIQNADGVEVKKISSALMMAQYYNSDSETESESDDVVIATGVTTKSIDPVTVTPVAEKDLDFVIPPESLQNIIDKTAVYVIKNGTNFEDILRTKDDPRFSFLDASSEYHRYYIYKVSGKVPDREAKTENGIEKTNKNKNGESKSNNNHDVPSLKTPKIISKDTLRFESLIEV